MGKETTNEVVEGLIAYWHLHRQFDANISDLAKYTRVSRDTAYRWINRTSQPKERKIQLIQEWLEQKIPQE